MLSFEIGKTWTIFANVREVGTRIAKIVNLGEKYKNYFSKGYKL